MSAASDRDQGNEQTHGVRLRVAYDGSDFAGWQAQPGARTVQQTLAEAIERIACHPVRVRGASRTDTGVHAAGQVAAFATARALEPTRWIRALNRYLPPDVAVWQAARCDPAYEPRFDARDKTYRYLFHLAAVRDPLLRNRAWHLERHLRRRGKHAVVPGGAAVELDLDAMRQAAEQLQGTHDFRAFRSADDTRSDTVRTLSRVAFIERYADHPHLLALEVTGSAFMKNMVRILAGTLIDVGSGRIPVARLPRLLDDAADRRDAGVTAPPQGLTLVQVTLDAEHSPAAPDR